METMKNTESRLRELGEHVVPQMEALEKKLEAASKRARQFIKEQPGACLLGALAAGFVIGRIVRGRD
ncbi:MAG: hypothetical protein ACKVPX_09570 [Myxococcaceae bacterium]